LDNLQTAGLSEEVIRTDDTNHSQSMWRNPREQQPYDESSPQDFVGGTDGPGVQPSPEVKEQVYRAFLESNEVVRRKFFPDREALFFPPLRR
jgi:hypothetical protein